MSITKRVNLNLKYKKMTPEDKALNLIDRFKFENTVEFDQAKQSAIMCVFEIIDMLTDWEMDSAYWQEVRFHLYSIGTGRNEAMNDRFNKDL